MSVPRFAAVGALGFAIDAGLLHALHAGAGLDPRLARIPSFAVAVLATYVLNRRWTFGGGSAPLDRGALAYVAVQAGGVALNYAVFALLVTAVAWFARHPLAALAAGSGLAAVANYLAVRALFAGRA